MKHITLIATILAASACQAGHVVERTASSNRTITSQRSQQCECVNCTCVDCQCDISASSVRTVGPVRQVGTRVIEMEAPVYGRDVYETRTILVGTETVSAPVAQVTATTATACVDCQTSVSTATAVAPANVTILRERRPRRTPIKNLLNRTRSRSVTRERSIDTSTQRAGPAPVSYGETNDALSVVNQKRMQRRLQPLSYDPALTQVAQRKSNFRASRHISGHDGSNMGRARAEGVGTGRGLADFRACYLYDRNFQLAGAAVANDRQGRSYYTLMVR